ncbi:MAG: 4Fe-4S dicluster domain-containing protein [Odoribacteraceae bacterium]|jgi:ferredoxin|nr:4Fe-4S dicluster domain-containing protein [Odoribacteraceae bacterium]
MLKKVRVGVSAAACVLITFYFIDFAELMPHYFGWLARVQLLPALLSRGVLAVVVAWLLLTLAVGRVYCSSICPMGIFQDLVAWISRRAGKKRKRYRYRRPRVVVRVLALVVPMVLFWTGFPLLLGLLEPYSAYGRMVTAVFKPLYMAGNNLLEAFLSLFNHHALYRVGIFVQSLSALLVGLLTLAVIGALAWRYGRTWCNTFCPVGAVLGFLSKYSLFRVRLDADKCTRCGACAARCKAGCIDSKEKRVDGSRCVACFNCLDTCKFQALSFSLAARRRAGVGEAGVADASRRRFLLASAATAVAVPGALAAAPLKLVTGTTERRKQFPVAPPGAVSYEHLSSHCTSCHLCVSKCPSRVLKPAFMEYGLGGMMQPTVYYEKGFCNYNCTVCGDVCPNGAIHSLTTEQKQMTQIGHVVFVEELCVVITDGTSCGACSEHCPTQAVTMIPHRDGLTRPHVDTSICVGCGGCEYICPVRPLRAIYVEGHPVQAERAAFTEEEEKEVIIDDFGF